MKDRETGRSRGFGFVVRILFLFMLYHVSKGLALSLFFPVLPRPPA